MTGCFSDSGTNPDNGNSASIQGELRGDFEGTVSGSGSGADNGWEGTVVTTHTISANGTLSGAIDSGTADASGHFNVETELRGEQELILRAQRGSTEWMARFQGKIEDSQTENARPLNLESTLEAQVYAELKKTEPGREVPSSEVNAAISAEASARARVDYRGTETARQNLVAHLAASVKAASRARAAFLAEADAQYEANRARIDSARVRAEAEFNASLHAAASDTAQARAAERVYLDAMVNAYLRADVERTSYARSSEASYHAFVRASAELSDSIRTASSRGYARILVIASDTAMRDEFRGAGASSARLQLVVDAGARFRASVDTASTRARIDSAVVRFRADVRAAFNSTSDTTFSLFGTVAGQLATALDSLSTSLQGSIQSSTSGDAVGEAYAEAHVEAQAQLQGQLQAVNEDDEEAEAAANVLAFLSVSSHF